MALGWIKQQARSRTGIIQNAIWLLSDKVAKALCMLVISALLARHFGPESYGLLAYAIAFVAIFQAIANLGLDAITVRDIIHHRDCTPEIVGTVFCLRLIAGLILWPLTAFCAFLLEPGDTNGFLITCLVGGILLFQVTDTIDLWFQSQGQNRRTVIAKLSVYVIGTALRLYLLYLNCDLWVFAAMVTIDAIVLSFALTLLYRSFPIGQRWSFSRDRSASFLKEGWPFMLSGVSVLIYGRIDQIMIKNILGEESLGIYSVAVLISGFFAIIPVSLCTALAPYVANLKRLSQESYVRTINLVGLGFLTLAVAISVVVYFLADLVVQLLYGDQYLGAGDVLRIHVVSNIPLFLGVAQSLWIVNERKGNIYLYKTASAAMVSISLNYFLIPVYGINAAAFVAIITTLVAAILSNIIWDREFFKIQMNLFFKPISVYFSK